MFIARLPSALLALAVVGQLAACANTGASGGSGTVTDTTVSETAGTDATAGTDNGIAAADNGIAPVDVGNTSGEEKTIPQIHAASKSNCDEKKIIDTLKGVTIKSVIVTSPIDKTTTSKGKKLAGVYVQQKGGGADSGIYVSTDQGGPLDGLKMGDVITIIGNVAEFYCFTQVSPTVVTPEGTDLPTPTTVEIGKIGDKATAAENHSWEGALVTLNNVVVSDIAALGSDGKPHGDIYIGSSDSDSALLVSSSFGFFLTTKNADGSFTSKWPKGTKFASITGVLQYGFTKYSLLPLGDKSIVVAK